MKDLSREEELKREIYRMADECDNRKWMRVKKTFFVIAGVIYLIELYCALSSVISDPDIVTILGLLLAPILIAGIVMYISSLVFAYIIGGAMQDEKAIAKKIGELNAIQRYKYTDYEEECKEAKKQLEDTKKFLNQIIEEYKDLECIEENEDVEKQLEDLKRLFRHIEQRFYNEVE